MNKSFANPVCVISLFLIAAFFVLPISAQNSAIDFKNKSDSEAVNGGGAPAQTNSANDAKNEYAVLGGIAPAKLSGYQGTRDSSFGFAGFRYARRLAASESVALKYTIDFIPLAFLSYDRQRVVQTAPGVFTTERSRTTAYGVSLTPIGFQLNFRRQKKVQPFFSINAGLIYFNKIVPDDRSAVFPERKGRRLNFTPSGSLGVEIATESGKSYTIGYKLHHISNASTGNINPGFDQNMIYFGYTFKKW